MGLDIDNQVDILFHMRAILSDLAYMIYSLDRVLVNVPNTIPLVDRFSQSINFSEQ